MTVPEREDAVGRMDFNAEHPRRPGVTVGEDLADQNMTLAFKLLAAEQRAELDDEIAKAEKAYVEAGRDAELRNDQPHPFGNTGRQVSKKEKTMTIQLEPREQVIDSPIGEQRFRITDDRRLKITCPARGEQLLVDVDVVDLNEFLCPWQHFTDVDLDELRVDLENERRRAGRRWRDFERAPGSANVSTHATRLAEAAAAGAAAYANEHHVGQWRMIVLTQIRHPAPGEEGAASVSVGDMVHTPEALIGVTRGHLADLEKALRR